MERRKEVTWSSCRMQGCSKNENVAPSPSAAETQAAADGDDETVHVRLCLKESMFGHIVLRDSEAEARQVIPAPWLTPEVSATPWLDPRLLIR